MSIFTGSIPVAIHNGNGNTTGSDYTSGVIQTLGYFDDPYQTFTLENIMPVAIALTMISRGQTLTPHPGTHKTDAKDCDFTVPAMSWVTLPIDPAFDIYWQVSDYDAESQTHFVPVPRLCNYRLDTNAFPMAMGRLGSLMRLPMPSVLGSSAVLMYTGNGGNARFCAGAYPQRWSTTTMFDGSGVSLTRAVIGDYTTDNLANGAAVSGVTYIESITVRVPKLVSTAELDVCTLDVYYEAGALDSDPRTVNYTWAHRIFGPSSFAVNPINQLKLNGGAATFYCPGAAAFLFTRTDAPTAFTNTYSFGVMGRRLR